MNIPLTLIRYMPLNDCVQFYLQLKRSRLKMIPFLLNGETAFIPRKEAVQLVAYRLQGLHVMEARP